jgi:hypothetical protein
MISIVLVMIGLVLSLFALFADEEHLGPFPHQFFAPLVTIAYGVVGALVAARHPRNPIGWMFCATGFLNALSLLAAGYHLYDQHVLITASLPGAKVVYWLMIWIWVPGRAASVHVSAAPIPGRTTSIRSLASYRLGRRAGSCRSRVRHGFHLGRRRWG